MNKIYSLALIIIIVVLFSCKKDDSNNEDSCSKPNFSLSDNGNNSIQLNFHAQISTYYEVEYGANGFSKGSGQVLNNISSISGLSTGAYDVYIRQNCGGSEWSQWSNPETIYITQGNGGGGNSGCGAPNNLSVSEFNYCYTTLDWEDYNYINPIADYYEIEYGNQGYTLGTGTLNTVNNSSYRDGQFYANQNYDFYVRAYCGNEGYSDWVGPKSFVSTRNTKVCAQPQNVSAIWSSSSTIEYSFDNNGDCRYEYTLVRPFQNPDTDGNIQFIEQYTVTGHYTGATASDYHFCARTVCEDGTKSAWVKILVN